MDRKLCLVIVDSKYCDYLRKWDNKVPYNYDNKNRRPFIGILFEINKCLYFAPLTSPKKKHLTMKNSIDFYRLSDGKLGAINFNNMIPVHENNIKIIDIKKINDKQYSSLLREQYRYLLRNQEDIFKLSKILYNSYINKRLNSNLIKRCCNFNLLEKKCNEYNKEKQAVTC